MNNKGESREEFKDNQKATPVDMKKPVPQLPTKKRVLETKEFTRGKY